MGGSEEGAALETTGAVSDVVGKKAVAEVVHLQKSGERKRMRKIKIRRGRSVDGGYEWEGGAAELGEAGFKPRSKGGGVFEFAILPGCFEAVGVSKTAGGKGGVGELPQEQRVVGGGRGGRGVFRKLNIEHGTSNFQR